MLRKVTIFVCCCCLFAAFILSSCAKDREERILASTVREGPPYADLQQKDDVLYNLALVWNELDVEHYDRLLDDGFVFIFSVDDCTSGKTPSHYTRAQELRAMTLMTDYSRSDRVIDIDVRLFYPGDQWTERIPSEGERPWYYKEVAYNITIKTADDMTYTSTGLKARIWIRWARIEETGEELWRLAFWQDDV